MAMKIFTPQLKNDIFLNLPKLFNIIFAFIFGVIIYLIYGFFAKLSLWLTILSSILFMFFSYGFLSNVSCRVKMWDKGAPYTIIIDTVNKNILLDDIYKFNIQQINYIDIIEYESLSSLMGFHTYYSVINAVMKFYLKDGQIIDFYVQNATQLIQIINLLRKLGADVKASITEETHEGAVQAQWLIFICIIILGIILYFSNN